MTPPSARWSKISESLNVGEPFFLPDSDGEALLEDPLLPLLASVSAANWPLTVGIHIERFRLSRSREAIPSLPPDR